MSYSYDRRMADKVPTAIVPVTRFFGRSRGAYAKYLEEKTGMPWEASDWTVKGFGGSVAFRFYLKDQAAGSPASRLTVEINVSPTSMFGNDPEGLLNVRADAERNGRSLAWVNHDKVKPEIFKTPGAIFNEQFFAHLIPSLHGDYSRELGEVQAAMNTIIDGHKALDGLLAELDKLVKEDPVGHYEAIEKLAREASYHADSLGRSVGSLPQSIEVIVKKK